MPIRIVVRNIDAYPIVFCDHCNRRIRNANDGDYAWEWSDKRASDVFFAHKTCSRALQQAHPEITHWESLSSFHVYLGHNLKIHPRHAQHSADLGAQR